MKKDPINKEELHLGLKKDTQEHLEISETGYGLVSVTEKINNNKEESQKQIY